MMTYEQADKILGNREEKKLRYAERLVRHHPCDMQGAPATRAILVTRHGHPVVTIYPDGTYRLDSCGYPTVTTKKTLNTYGPVQVYQEHSEWFVATTNPYHDGRLSRSHFRDGMIVNDLGQVYVNPDAFDAVKKTF